MRIPIETALRAIPFGALIFSAAACGMTGTGASDPASSTAQSGSQQAQDSTQTDTRALADTPGSCTNPCECADRGPPDYSNENAGTQPTGADSRQRAMLVRANHWRTAAGLPALNGSDEIERAASAHAQFLAVNPQTQCWSNPHRETETCSSFTGDTMGERMTAKGYAWARASEVINWESEPEAVVDGWMWTVYHRQPLLDYRLEDAGAGYATGSFTGRTATHNVMDLGLPEGSTPSRPSGPTVFPIPGLTGVPASFRGDLEGPTPPWPGGGTWPQGRSAGTVISMHFPSDTWTVTEHHLYSTEGHACTEVPHMYISKANDPNLNRGTPSNDVFLYANAPLTSATEYVVWMSGTLNGSAFSRTWAFTTQ